MDDEYITGHSPTFKNPAQYLLEHLRTLTTEISIDNAILSVIARHWG